MKKINKITAITTAFLVIPTVFAAEVVDIFFDGGDGVGIEEIMVPVPADIAAIGHGYGYGYDSHGYNSDHYKAIEDFKKR